jgi:lysophospholipase
MSPVCDNFELIDEKNFDKMKEAELFLDKRRREGREGALHYEYYISENAKANIVISHGYTESAIKYREMTYYFVNMNYNVFVPEHRGHGTSLREVALLQLTHIDKFDTYAKDLKRLNDKVIKVLFPFLPLYYFGHSMGGAIGARYAELYPDDFSKIILITAYLLKI